MEESVTSVDFLTYYKQCMKLEPVDANMYSPLVLAYIGDAVYELIIRSRVVNQGSMQVNKMHKRSAGLVKAGTQAALIRAIEDLLTAEEHAVYKRGRNAKSVTTAKNASVIDYRTATGLEALAGWNCRAGKINRPQKINQPQRMKTPQTPWPEKRQET